MDVSPMTVWWVAAGLAVAAELATGTFYLLMIGLGLASGGMAALFGATTTLQIVVAAVIGGGATLAWHGLRGTRDRTGDKAAHENRDVNLDIGERVHVDGWATDRTTRVQYRGSSWGARLAHGAPPVAGEFTVSAVEGNWLVLAPRANH